MFDEQMENRDCYSVAGPYRRPYAQPYQKLCPCMPRPQKKCCHYCIDLKMEIREIKPPCCRY